MAKTEDVIVEIYVTDDDEPHTACLEIEAGLSGQDRITAITEAATVWCSDHGFEYDIWFD